MTHQDHLDDSVFYSPIKFRSLFKDPKQPIVEKNLSFNRDIIEVLRSAPENFKLNPDPAKLLSTISQIISSGDQLYTIRSALVLFAFKNCFNIFPYFTSLLTEDTIVYEGTRNHPIFNDIFYQNLSQYPDLMICLIESINFFIKKSTLKYDVVYPIINSIILFNENSNLPIMSQSLNFMEEADVKEEFKSAIKTSYPIIIPYPIKFRDYCEEPLPSLTVNMTVDRAHVLDTIFSIDTFEGALNGKFHIRFENERGIDCGGLSRDFVDIAWKALRDSPLFYKLENNSIWFNYFPNPTPEILHQYKCVGIFLALCIKNKMTIPIRFPLFFYKKLLNRPFNLYDLEFYNKNVARIVQNLLEKRIDSNCFLDMSFPVRQYQQVGRPIEYEFDISRPYPNFVDVTNNLDWEFTPVVEENKFNYVANLVDFIFIFTVQKQWDNFREGFLMVSHSAMLDNSFRLDELDVLISGQIIVEWKKFKENSICSQEQSVKWFWEIFDEWNDQQKFNLLKFISGTSAIPIGGIESVSFSIMDIPYDPNSPYPKSHTCFHRLDLPRYTNKEEEKTILTNIINSVEHMGFGMA